MTTILILWISLIAALVALGAPIVWDAWLLPLLKRIELQ